MCEVCSNCCRTKKELSKENISLFSPFDKGLELENLPFSYGYEKLCAECFEALEDEFSDISHIIPNESEDDFWEHEDEDGPYGSSD